MKYFTVLSRMKDERKNNIFYLDHVEYVRKQRLLGNLFATGKFTDGTGGLAIYIAKNLEEAKKLALNDPYVIYGAREIEVHEWEAVFK